MITQESLKQLFDYHPNGYFVRKKTGKAVVCSMNKGQRYLKICIAGKSTSLHRMIFLHQHGYLPKCLDHIDGNRENNKIENLREVTQQQNCLNSKHKSHSKLYIYSHQLKIQNGSGIGLLALRLTVQKNTLVVLRILSLQI